MSRMILRDENIRCDVCNRKGAFDFYGDFYCEHCLTEDENGHTSVTSEHRLKYTEELEALSAELIDKLDEVYMWTNDGNLTDEGARDMIRETVVPLLRKYAG